jgi:hypothetical protein
VTRRRCASCGSPTASSSSPTPPTSAVPPPRLDGIDEIVDYFTGLGLFGAFTIGDVEIWPTGPEAWVLEMHASSTVLATGAPYEQDYVARFALAPDGRLTWMREYWDPTRA